jgi:glycine/D-amino acid oxidase-like deaminating enzyme
VTPLAPAYREEPFWWSDAGGLPSVTGQVPRSADVVIVGGGYTGVMAAWELARRRKAAVVLEAEVLGYGASTRNGGMVLPGFKAGLEQVARREGERGVAFYRYSVDAVGLVEQIIKDESIDCQYRASGNLELAYRPSHAQGLKASVAAYATIFGERVRFVDREVLEQEIGSTAYFGGMAVELGGGLQPAKYHAGLVGAARRAGATICDRAPVTRLMRGPRGGFAVETPRGTIEASDVLLATNGYTTGLVPSVQRRVVPVGSYIITTQPMDPALARTISPRGRMFFDTKNFLYYWRVLPDNRMLFGGRASFAPTTIARARDWLYRAMLTVHPQLQDVSVSHAWGGQLGFTLDRVPHIGKVDGITYALGYCGTGVAMATAFGRQAAAWMSGEALPSCLERPFPAIPLYRGRPWFLPAVGLYYQWRDAIN